MKTGKIPGL